MSKVLELKNVCKSYQQGKKSVEVLRSCDLSLSSGEIISIVGTSGSGKSTLLHIAGLLDSATSGEVFIDDVPTSKLSPSKKGLIRSQNIGFVYQNHNLLHDFTVLENVMIPQLILGETENIEVRVRDILYSLGLEQRLQHYPTELSGGEQQRVAIARALANTPKILLADEPTGNLDVLTSNKVMDVLLNTAKNHNVASIIITHNDKIARLADKLYLLQDKLLKVEGL